MENASKALIIAGAVFVAALVISISVYLLTSFREYSVAINENIRSNQNAMFNSKFINYSSPGETVKLTGYQVWNILSYVAEINSLDDVDDYYIECNGKITVDNYRKKLFFVDSLKESYSYSYTMRDDGVVDSISIS